MRRRRTMGQRSQVWLPLKTEASVERFSFLDLSSDHDKGEFSDDGSVRRRVGARTLTDDRDPFINGATQRLQNLLQPPPQPHNAGDKERRRTRINNIYIKNDNTTISNVNRNLCTLNVTDRNLES